MLAYFPGKEQCALFFSGGLTLGHNLQIVLRQRANVRILHQNSARNIFRTHFCGACEILISRRFFFAANVARADSSNEGAAITSKKSLAISSAATASIRRFTPITPPNADTGSHSRAFLCASARVLPVAVP